MRMPPGLRKLALVVHITLSVGWMGAIVAVLGTALVGLTHDDEQIVRAVYTLMASTGRFVLVPFAIGSLLTGVVQSLGTHWGLLRHHWVVAKLAINVLTTAVLLSYLRTFDTMAARAADPTVPLDQVRTASPLLHAALALVALSGATILSVYKPRGLTRRGWRHRRTLSAG